LFGAALATKSAVTRTNKYSVLAGSPDTSSDLVNAAPPPVIVPVLNVAKVVGAPAAVCPEKPRRPTTIAPRTKW
jgi:hypothetical protein